MEVPVLSFSRTLQAYRENMSMTFKRYLYFSFISKRNLSLQDQFPKHHQYLLQYTDYEETFYVQVCVRYTCSGLTTTPPHPFFKFYWPLLALLLTHTLLHVWDCNKLYPKTLLLLL
jgi:hypothetical protein